MPEYYAGEAVMPELRCANCGQLVEQATLPNGDVVWRHMPRGNIYCSKRYKATPKKGSA